MSNVEKIDTIPLMATPIERRPNRQVSVSYVSVEWHGRCNGCTNGEYRVGPGDKLLVAELNLRSLSVRLCSACAAQLMNQLRNLL